MTYIIYQLNISLISILFYLIFTMKILKSNFYNNQIKSFSMMSKLKEYFKGRQEKLLRKKNLQESLNIFKETDQFITDKHKEKIEKQAEYALSTNSKEDKYLFYKERKQLDIEPLNNDQLTILNQIMNKIDTTQMENQIKSMKSTSTLTIWEKIEYYEINSEGKIFNPYLQKMDNEYKTNNYKDFFQSIEEYNTFKNNVILSLKEELKSNLTPMEYCVTQGKNTERAYTGYYADFYEVGTYSCKCCSQKLFSSTHKYKTDSGWAAFWNYLPLSLNFKDDYLDKYKVPTQAILPIKFVGNKPIKRITCSHVSK